MQTMDGVTIVDHLITSVREVVTAELTSAGQPPRLGRKITTSRNACKPRPVQLEQSSAEQIDDDGLAEILKANKLAQFQKPWARLNADQKLDRLTSYIEIQEDESSQSAKLEFLTGLLSRKALAAKDVEYDVESASVINIPRLIQTESGEYKLGHLSTAEKANAAAESATQTAPATAIRKPKTNKPTNLNRILSTMKK